MKRLLLFLIILGLVDRTAVARGAEDATQVVVVYNSRVPESKGVAQHYAAKRHVPSTQIIALDLPDGEAISRKDFRELLQKPLLKAFEEHGWMHIEKRHVFATDAGPERDVWVATQTRIRYLVLCYGLPLLIVKDATLRESDEDKLQPALRRNEAAVDSELACLPVIEHMMLAGPHINPAYGSTNANLLNTTNGILMVARLDGPTAAIAHALVDKAMEAETNGLWGRAYFDMRGLATNDTYRMGDDWIYGASELCRHEGFETIVDSNYGTFKASFPLSEVAFYAGWYDEHVSGPFARPTVEFMPGAFAYHLQSFSAATLRSTKRQWAGPLLDRGVTATMGCVDEPYLTGTPNIAIFFARFLYAGFSFGEAAYASQPFLSWQTTVIGDPLYRPFARNLAELQNDLMKRSSKLVEWPILQRVNLSLLSGAQLDRVVAALENTDGAKTSAVLEEKLADLYFAQGKPSSSVYALQAALRLNPTPQQRVRLMLALAGQLPPLGREPEAYEVYKDFLQRFPDYPAPLDIYKPLYYLAKNLGKAEDEQKYKAVMDQLALPQSK